MNTDDVATQIRHEHEAVRLLVAKLQEKVAVPPRIHKDRWLESTKSAFEHFKAHLIRHMAMEEEGGYLTDVVEQRPVLTPVVERLAFEHVEFRQLMASICRGFAELTAENNLLIRDLCLRIQTLLQFVDHHEHEENLLVMSVLLNDLGTED